MKSYAKSSVVAVALLAIANVSIAHAASAPGHHRYRQAPGGIEAKAFHRLSPREQRFATKAAMLLPRAKSIRMNNSSRAQPSEI
jgi:hypothetical protein